MFFQRQLAVLCYVSLDFTGVAYSYHDAPNNSTKQLAKAKKNHRRLVNSALLSPSHIFIPQMNEKLEKSFIRSKTSFPKIMIASIAWGTIPLQILGHTKLSETHTRIQSLAAYPYS
jgi:hypothetical protein